MKLLIVGGVAGGASAAARARRIDESAEIIMFERGPDVSFANCGLPYHIGQVIAQRDKLLVTTADKLRQRFRLDVRTQHDVLSIDRTQKRVRVRNLQTGTEYDESYDKIILAPGAAPIRPPLPGIDLPNVYTLRTLGDMDRIKRAIDQACKSAVIVGGGFIGLELAENFVHRNVKTTVVDIGTQVLAPFDAEMTKPIAEVMLQKGVELLLGEQVVALREGLVVEFKSGKTRSADLVIMGVGVKPENQLAVAAGLQIGPRGGIWVNQFMQTSDPDIFAAGDAIETYDAVTGDRTQVPLAGPANRQGRIAADNAFGRRVTYRGTQATAVLGVFDRTAAMTGQSEKGLVRAGKKFAKTYIHPAHHAGYFPGAEAMTLKLLFDPDTGKILGAQGVGGQGVDKRIDVLAIAIQARMTVYDLEEAELCYAPQFGSAKDPINMLGFVASGVLRGDHPQSTWEQVRDSGVMVVDVRTPTEFANGHIARAINIPVDDLRDPLAELPKNQPIVVYCQVGQRGYLATRILLQKGYDVKNLAGGYKTYLLYQPS